MTPPPRSVPYPSPPQGGPSQRPPELEGSRLLRFVGRAMRRRCPNCGARHIFATYFRLRPHCPHCPRCGSRLERGEGDYFIGAYTLNLVAAELVFALVFVGRVVATWPNPPWDFLEWGSVVGVILAPVLFYPFSKTLWLAADLASRPLTPEDLERRG